MQIKLEKDEKIEDLQFGNLKIIQNKRGFCFGMDSILLSDFAKGIKEGAKVVDLGTGTGIIATLLCGKTNLREIIGIEKQKEVYEMAQKSIQLNHLENRFKIIHKDIMEVSEILEKNTFDAIVTNPPYKKKGTGLENEEEKKIIARHETTATLEDFIKISKDLLKDKGEFYMVHRPERLVDIVNSMRKYKIEPKILRFVYTNQESEPKLMLIKGIKNAKPFLKIQNNLYIYDENGKYTEEINKIYNKREDVV
ncbi:MAG: tRNA1(Val) (adenine(37)-N6)-methyltransferase [Clostridia bacterium]|nr:tRNA1(Val) (adenine(37)-N6)-methyltransferase [Clostridia bacterium]